MKIEHFIDYNGLIVIRNRQNNKFIELGRDQFELYHGENKYYSPAIERMIKELGAEKEEAIDISSSIRQQEEKVRENFFDENGKVVPQKIADYLKKHECFKTMRDNGDIYFFNGEFYDLRAETIIKEKSNKLLGDKSKTHTVNEVIELIKYDTYTDRVEADKKFLCLKNGLFDLENGELKPFDSDIFITRQLPIEFDAEADCPNIKKFISEIVSEQDISVIQELIGYCLHNGYEIQKAAMFVGEGSNGKSTLLSLIKIFLGAENVSAVSLQTLDSSRFATAALFGKMANLCNDLPDAALHRTGNFKMLTGGDLITAERKFGQPFQFTNTAKLLFSCNKVPESEDRTPAFFRRWVFMNFPHKFEGENDDKNLLKKLTIPQELSGLFNWAIEGLERLLKSGDFTNAKSTEAMQEHYERLSSPVAAFVKDCIESGEQYTIDSDGTVIKSELYSAFVRYCEENNLPACASNTFGRDLPRYLLSVMASKTRQDGRLQHCWRGIGFVTNEKEENEPQKKLK